MTSMIKKRLYNASSTIFIIAEASILFELPLKLFGNSCSSAYSTIYYEASHLQQDLEYSTIAMIPLLLPTMMKSYPLEESYLQPDDLFCHPISYVTVSLTLLLFFYCLIEHISRYMADCCVLVCILFHPEEPLQSPNLSPSVLPCLHVIQFL